MIARARSLPLIPRLVSPIAWHGDRRIAVKLHGFAMTELGSALDMFRAAEAASEPEHRRLFLRHAVDEARHAQRFREEALRLDARAVPRAHERLHARPEDLYRRLGPERFLAFVHLSEARAERHFRVLARHFASARPSLSRVFEQIAREERFHVAYSRHLLGLLHPEETRPARVGRALRRERRALAWAAWRRSGARLGRHATTLIMALVFALVLPLFALTLRLSKRGAAPPGWHPASPTPSDLTGARRQA
jgi:rubrerythrin